MHALPMYPRDGMRYIVRGRLMIWFAGRGWEVYGQA